MYYQTVDIPTGSATVRDVHRLNGTRTVDKLDNLHKVWIAYGDRD
jgi:hypothetical protein